MAKYVLQVTVSVPDETPMTVLVSHMSDALSIGCEQLDEDSGTEMPGIVGRFTIVSIES